MGPMDLVKHQYSCLGVHLYLAINIFICSNLFPLIAPLICLIEAGRSRLHGQNGEILEMIRND